MVKDADLKIWLDAPIMERARRVARREGISVEEAFVSIAEREKGNKKRYLNLYGIDIDDKSIYDLIINTAHWNPPGGVFAIVKAAIDHLYPDGNAGGSGGLNPGNKR